MKHFVPTAPAIKSHFSSIVIPSDWETVHLEDLPSADAPICYGILMPGPDISNGIAVVKVKDYAGKTINPDKVQKTTFEIDAQYQRSRIQTGDILISIRGGTGDLAMVPKELDGANITQDTARIRIKDFKTRTFLFHALSGDFVQRQIDLNTVGQAVTGINLACVRSLVIPFPPVNERGKITEILSACDEAIEKTGELIKAKQRQKKALMQRLLTGKKRLPGFGGKGGRTAYRFFDLPSDWICPHVREIAQEHSERNGDSVSHTVLACSKHLGFVESAAYFKKQVYSEDTSNYKVIRRGWFGFPSNHVEEGSIGLLTTHESGIASPIYIVFEVNKRICPEYLYALFKTETFRHIFSVTTNASVDRRGSLRWESFSGIRVPCPTIEEQQAIVEVNRAATQEIKVLTDKLDALKQQKKSLMQKLLTGQIRVKI